MREACLSPIFTLSAPLWGWNSSTTGWSWFVTVRSAIVRVRKTGGRRLCFLVDWMANRRPLIPGSHKTIDHMQTLLVDLPGSSDSGASAMAIEESYGRRRWWWWDDNVDGKFTTDHFPGRWWWCCTNRSFCHYIISSRVEPQNYLVVIVISFLFKGKATVVFQ